MTSTIDFDEFCWNLSDLDEALPSVARELQVEPLPHERAPFDMENFLEWLSFSAASAGLEVTELQLKWSDIEEAICSGDSYLLRVGLGTQAIVLLRATRRTATLLSPGGRVGTVKVRDLLDFVELRSASDFPNANWIPPGLDDGSLDEATKEQIRRALRSQDVGLLALHVSVPPSGPPKVFFGYRRIFRLLVGIVSSTLIVRSLEALSWAILGVVVFGGSVETGWLWVWGLALLMQAPFDGAAQAHAADLTGHLGAKLRQKVMLGVLLTNQGELRRRGTSEFLGRVIKSGQLEPLLIESTVTAARMLSYVLVGVTALVAVSSWVLLGCLLLFLAYVFHVSRRYFTACQEEFDAEIGLSNLAVESMLGHETRVVQSPAEDSRREDLSVEDYLAKARAADGLQCRIVVWLAWGWMVVGVLIVGVDFILLDLRPWYLAASISAVLVIRAFTSDVGPFVRGFGKLVWTKSLFDDFSRAADKGPPRALTYRPRDESRVVVSLRDVSFSYPDGRKILDRVNLTVHRGDHVMLKGASGSGKSTLASVMSGFEPPGEGLLLAGGLDSYSLGPEGWRRTAAVSPQFNENHIFDGTFAFNLLLGRRWPATRADYEEAERVIDQLGLRPLVERMPRGLAEPLGQTGWQLSHGERSRVFMARALLQEAPLVLLDENLGSLDDRLAARVLELLTEGDRALILISHG